MLVRIANWEDLDQIASSEVQLYHPQKANRQEAAILASILMRFFFCLIRDLAMVMSRQPNHTFPGQA